MTTDKTHWYFEKFKGDLAIYAFCPNCGFSYNPSTIDEHLNPIITKQYKYCPMCGKYLYVEGNELDVVWNERHIIDTY